MSRDVDQVIRYVMSLTHLPLVQRQIMVNRLDPRPTQDEIERASEQVYPSAAPSVPAPSATPTEEDQ